MKINEKNGTEYRFQSLNKENGTRYRFGSFAIFFFLAAAAGLPGLWQDRYVRTCKDVIVRGRLRLTRGKVRPVLMALATSGGFAFVFCQFTGGGESANCFDFTSKLGSIS